MSIQITVIDPANTSSKELGLVRDMIDYFIANNTSTGERRAAPAVPIAPDDRPDTGVVVVSPEAAFGAAAGNPNVAFSAAAGNPNAAFAVVNVPPPGSPFTEGAGIPPAPSAGPNEAPSPMPSGTPCAPGNGSQMAGAPIDLDKNGLPYDSRIHSAGATKNADGTWRGKRGVDPAVLASVTAQLRQAMSIPAPGNVTPIVPQAPAVPNAPPAAPISSGASPSAGAGPQTGFAAPAAPIDFVGLAGKVGPLLQAGRLTQAEVEAACQSVGLANMSLLIQRGDLVASVNAVIDQILASKG